MVFSVSLDFDSFRIESGFGTFGSAQLPQRGCYSRLLQLLSLNVVDEQREDFLRIFSAQGLRAALAEQHTSVSEVFCFQKDASEVSPEENANEWYEFRAEQIPDPTGARSISSMSARLPEKRTTGICRRKKRRRCLPRATTTGLRSARSAC